MRLLRLYAHNFKRLRFEEPIEFGEGVTLISGLNEAGKSSILDAILYALYGRVLRPPGKARNEDIIAYGSKEAVVWLEFEAGGRRFRVNRRIHRTRAGKADLYELLPDGRPKPLATEVRKVNEEIVERLGGITFDEIVSSTVVAQKDLARLVQQRADDRRKVINVFLNLDSFNTVLEELNEERRDLEGTGPSRPGRLNVEREKLKRLEDELREFRERGEEVERLNRENLELTRHLEAKRREYGEKEGLHQALTHYDDALRRREQLEAQLRLKRQRLEEHRRQLAILEQQILEKKRELEAQRGLGEAQPLLDQLKAEMERGGEIDRQLKSMEENLARLEAEISTLKAELGGLEPGELEGLERSGRRLKPLGLGLGVALAGAVLALAMGAWAAAILLGGLATGLAVLFTRSLAKVMRLAEVQGLMGRRQLLIEKSRELEGLKGSLEARRREKGAVEAHILEICSGFTRYTHILQKHRSAPLEAAREILESAGVELQRYSQLREALATLEEGRARAEAALDAPALEAEIRELEAQLAAVALPTLPGGLEFSRELLRQVAEERERLHGEVRALEARIEANTRRIEEARRFIEQHRDVEARVEEQRRRVQEIERRIRVVRSAIEAVEKTAEALRNRVKPAVERYMGHILPAITSGRYRAVRLDEDYKLEVYDPEAGEFRAKDVFSGGTEDQLLLAMRLAFALSLLPEAKLTKPEFLFLDEPLGSSDEIRRTGILQYLRNNLAANFKQIFLISHLPELEEAADHIIRVEEGVPLVIKSGPREGAPSQPTHAPKK